LDIKVSAEDLKKSYQEIGAYFATHMSDIKSDTIKKALLEVIREISRDSKGDAVPIREDEIKNSDSFKTIAELFEKSLSLDGTRNDLLTDIKNDQAELLSGILEKIGAVGTTDSERRERETEERARPPERPPAIPPDEEEEPAQGPSVLRRGVSFAGKMIGFGNPLGFIFTIQQVFGKLAGDLLGLLKSSFLDYNKKMREAAKTTGATLTLDEQRQIGGLYTERVKVIDQSLSNNDMLKQWGWAKEAPEAFKKYMAAFRDQFDNLEEIYDTENIVKTFSELANEARASGLGLKEYTDQVSEMRYKFQMDEEKTRKLVLASHDLTKDLTVETGSFLNNMKSLRDSFSTMQFSVDDLVGLNKRFAESIRDGKIAMSDVVNFAKGMKDADEGQQLGMASLLEEQGGIWGKSIIEKIRKTTEGDPLGMAQMLQGAASGSKTVAKELGFDSPESMQKMMRDISIEAVKNLAGEMSGGDKYAELSMFKKLQKAYGLETVSESTNMDVQLQMKKKTDIEAYDFENTTLKNIDTSHMLGSWSTFANSLGAKIEDFGAAQAEGVKFYQHLKNINDALIQTHLADNLEDLSFVINKIIPKTTGWKSIGDITQGVRLSDMVEQFSKAIEAGDIEGNKARTTVAQFALNSYAIMDPRVVSNAITEFLSAATEAEQRAALNKIRIFKKTSKINNQDLFRFNGKSVSEIKAINGKANEKELGKQFGAF